jgi:hypothetical protein
MKYSHARDHSGPGRRCLRVQYRGVEVPDARDRKRVRLLAELRFVFEDSRGREVDDFPRQVAEEEAVAQILGFTYDRKGKYDREGDRQTVASFFEPKAHLDGPAVLAGPGSPFALQLLVEGKPVWPRDRDGLAYAPIQREQSYAVRLINRSDLEVAVRLTIDGLSIFTFSELRQPATDARGKPNPRKGEPLYELVLVPPKSAVVIPGWHRTNQRADRFKVTEYARTGAALLGKDDAPVGTITATFAAAWEKDPPADEPPTSRGPGDDGTGFGQPVPTEVKPVVRTVGVVRASVSVRYTLPKTK